MGVAVGVPPDMQPAPPPPVEEHAPWPCLCTPPSHSPHWPAQGLTSTPWSPPLASSQNFHILFQVSAPSVSVSGGAHRGDSAHLNAYLSLPSLCPRAPGAGCGVAWAGSPASASGPCRGSPSRPGTPTTSASASGTSGWHAGKGR